MEDHSFERAFEEISRVESADVTELESATYGLFMHSQALTGYMETYTLFNKGGARQRHLNKLTANYVDSFGSFAQAVIRDTRMDDRERWTIIKRTVLDEELRRMAAMLETLGSSDIEFADIDEEEVDELMERLHGDQPFDAELAGDLTETFAQMTDNDIRLFKGLIEL